MTKKFVFSTIAVTLLSIFLALPNLATAANYWAISSSATPASLSTVASPVPTGAGFTTANRVTNVTDPNVTSVVFNIAAEAPGGYTLTMVTVDGKPVGAVEKIETVNGVTKWWGNYTYQVTGDFVVNKMVNGQIMANHSIVAKYTANANTTFKIKSIPSAGGWISGSVTVGLNSTPSFSIIANRGYTLEGVIIDGGAMIADTDGTYTFAAVSANHTIQGVFTANKSLNAILSIPLALSAQAGSTLDVIGTTKPGYTTGVSYDWTGTTCTNSAVGTDGATSTRAITVPATGSCTVSLKATADGMNNTTTATITARPSVNVCLYCHDGTGGPDQRVFSSSAHAAAGKTCASCHNPDGNLSHAYKAVASITCTPCHAGNIPPAGHPLETDNAACNTCHNPHSLAASCSTCHGYPPTELTVLRSGHTGAHTSATNCAACHGANAGSKPNHDNGTVNIEVSGAPHFNNITGALYPASYMTSRSDCTNCHYGNSSNQSIRQQWSKTGHADTTALPWIDYDFKTRSGCVQCHTTTGFIAYSTAKVTAAWGNDSDKTKEVLTCIGCHSDVANGVVRTVTPIKPFADDSYVNRNVGPSNICMNCHSGRNNGLSVVSGDFSNQAFIAPHYLAAGGVLHGKGGYNFPGQTYAFYSSNSHRAIGMGDNKGTGTNGPCIGCHMTSPEKHLFQAISSANGTIEAITSDACAKCHAAYLGNTQLNSMKADFNNALDALKALLAVKGFNYSTSYPYFSNTNWDSGQAGANTMGAAFNYVLLLNEPGAYAHNAEYTKKLVFDSIDYLHNGMITGDIDTALDSLVGNGITQAQADSLKAYQNSNSCSSCHASTPASPSHPAHLGSGYGFGCADCHAATAASNTALVSGTTTHLNGAYDVQAGTGRSFIYAGGTCSSISCHNNGDATWGATLGCAGCHGNPPTYPNGDPKVNSHAKHSFGCVTCHSGTTIDGITITNKNLHVNGIYDVTPGAEATFTYTYAATGGNCSTISCHGGTSATWGSTLGCATCHGNPPAYVNGTPKANNHGSHNFACSTCHSGTTTDGTTIADSTLHANGVYDVTPGTGTTFTYTFASTGGTCSNVNCHQGVPSATWGRSHIAAIATGNVLVFSNENIDHGAAGFSTEMDCRVCHYENLVTQHNGNCALCHSGATPPANALIGNWNRTCSQLSCHPTIHSNMGPDHNGVYSIKGASCDNCHDSSNDFPGPADKCTNCHSR
ncbi:MAG: hypothetical protein PHY09_13330 [Desulfuromonadaceae bacterium]|nr:hypothetical protein [Desulfuromonadaceae bacterium]MDD5107703.1 hypothetical protein [Desulfuromonadaceae bacterium]